MLLKIKFIGENERVKEALLDSGHTKYARAIKGVFWTDGVAAKNLPEFASVLSDINKKIPIEATLTDAEGDEEFFNDEVGQLEFTYNDIEKKVFLMMKSEIWLGDTTVLDAIKRMRDINEIEKELETSILDMDEKDVIETIKRFWLQGSGYITLTRKARLANDFSSMFEGKSLENWRMFGSQTNLYKLVDIGNISESITKENLLKFFKAYDNPQAAILLLLIFEGVLFSIKPEDDEMSRILKTDVVETGIYMSKRDRVLDLDDKVVKAVKTTMIQTYYRGRIKNNIIDPKIIDNEYVLRGIGGTRALGRMSYSGLRLRFMHAKEAFRYMFGADDFQPNTIRNLGKIHYVNKYMSEGMTYKHAVVKTLQRYDEYEFYNPSGEKSHETIKANNITREFRLKNLYDLYTRSELD